MNWTKQCWPCSKKQNKKIKNFLVSSFSSNSAETYKRRSVNAGKNFALRTRRSPVSASTGCSSSDRQHKTLLQRRTPWCSADPPTLKQLASQPLLSSLDFWAARPWRRQWFQRRHPLLALHSNLSFKCHFCSQGKSADFMRRLPTLSPMLKFSSRGSSSRTPFS